MVAGGGDKGAASISQMFSELLQMQRDNAKQFGDVYDAIRDQARNNAELRQIVERLTQCVESDVHRTPCDFARKATAQLNVIAARVEAHLADAAADKATGQKWRYDVGITIFRVCSTLIIGGLVALLIAGFKGWVKF